MTQLNNNKRLDESTGIGQDDPNKAMQLASETTESPATEKKTPLTLKLIGKVGVVVMLVLSMLMIPPPIKTKAADPVTTTVTFIVVTAASWLIGDVLSSAKAALLAAASRPNPPEASASVIGAFWTTNWYENLYKIEGWNGDTYQWTGNWTTETVTASQGDYKTTNAVGTRKDGMAMETDEAEVYLMNQRCSVKTVTYELFTTDYDPEPRYYNGLPYDGYLRDVYVTARADCLEQEKAKVLEQMNDDTLYFGTGFEISQMTYKVGAYKMESKFPPTKWPDLAHPKAVESGANKYKGRLYWKYCKVLEDGSWGTEKDGEIFFDFFSYKYHPRTHSACGDNQAITEGPDINDGITRRFVVKPRIEDRITKVFRRTGPFGFPMWDGRSYKTNSVVVGTKIDVEQYEPVYEGQ